MAPMLNTLGTKIRKTTKPASRLALPRQADEMFILAENIAEGCKTHGAGCGLPAEAEASVRERLDAAVTARKLYRAERATQLSKTASLQDADRQGCIFIRDAKAVLQKALGLHWSTAYEACGFPDQSLRVPSTRTKRAALVKSLAAYFETNPTQQVAAMGVEAATAAAVSKAYADATGEVNKGRASVGVKRKTRDGKVKALRKRVRGVVEDMKETLVEDDPNWRAFGFIPPSSELAPGAVAEVELSFLPDGKQLLTWPAVARTVRYRVRRQVVGTEARLELVASVAETQVVLPAVSPGAKVRVQVTAVNGGGAGQPGAIVESFTSMAAPTVARVA